MGSALSIDDLNTIDALAKAIAREVVHQLTQLANPTVIVQPTRDVFEVGPIRSMSIVTKPVSKAMFSISPRVSSRFWQRWHATQGTCSRVKRCSRLPGRKPQCCAWRATAPSTSTFAVFDAPWARSGIASKPSRGSAINSATVNRESGGASPTSTSALLPLSRHQPRDQRFARRIR